MNYKYFEGVISVVSVVAVEVHSNKSIVVYSLEIKGKSPKHLIATFLMLS